jgi:hypothetical protein
MCLSVSIASITLSHYMITLSCFTARGNVRHKNVYVAETNSMVWVRERTIPTEQPPLVGEVIANFFAVRGCHVVSVTDPYGRILGLLDRSRYFSIKYLLSCTHEAEWTPFQTNYFFFVVPGNRTRDPWICSQEHWPLDHRDGRRNSPWEINFTITSTGTSSSQFFVFYLGYKTCKVGHYQNDLAKPMTRY